MSTGSCAAFHAMLRAMGQTPQDRPTGPALKGTQFLSLGIEMVAPIVLFIFVGYRLDVWLGSKPWLFLLGAFLGIAVSFYTVFKRVGVIGGQGGEQ